MWPTTLRFWLRAFVVIGACDEHRSRFVANVACECLDVEPVELVEPYSPTETENIYISMCTIPFNYVFPPRSPERFHKFHRFHIEGGHTSLSDRLHCECPAVIVGQVSQREDGAVRRQVMMVAVTILMALPLACSSAALNSIEPSSARPA
jgi:hypothetical protein